MTDPLTFVAAIASFGALFAVVYLVFVVKKQTSSGQDGGDAKEIIALKGSVGTLNSNLAQLISDVGKIGESNVAVSTGIKGIQKFADLFSGSSQNRGHVGEVIIHQYLEMLPRGLWEEQYTIPGTSGRVDFVLRINSDSKQVLLPIDSKFSMPEDPEDFEKMANKLALKRVEEVVQYILPGVTTDYVLMILPNPVYYSLTHDTTLKMAEQCVVPAPVEGVMIVCSLALRTHQAMIIQESASRLRDYAQKVRSNLSVILEQVTPLEKWLRNAHKYARETHGALEDAVGELDRITRNIENGKDGKESIAESPVIQDSFEPKKDE